LKTGTTALPRMIATTDKPNMSTTTTTIEPGSRVIIYRARFYKLAGEIVSVRRGLCVVRLDDGRVIDVYTADLELA